MSWLDTLLGRTRPESAPDGDKRSLRRGDKQSLRQPEDLPTDMRRPFIGRRAIAGGRLSHDDDSYWAGGGFTLLAPSTPEDDWRTLDLDAETLDRMSASDLMKLLVDLSPDVSRSFWDFLRLCNPGWTALALRPGTQEIDERAQVALDQFLANVHGVYTTDNMIGADTVLGYIYAGAFLRGAFFAELVLDKRGRIPLNLAIPDPASARFLLVTDPVLGQVWQLGQQQAGKFTPLNRPTIQYVPIDPLPGSPYGRPLASPALGTVLFSIGLMNDLRRVVQQQGWPRLDITVDFEKLHAMMPADIENDPVKVQEWATAIINEVKTVYADLEPDDAYIHADTITVNRGVGTVDAQSLGAVDGIIRALERYAIRALKTLPILMGVNEATTETHAVQQWEIFAAGIKSLQHRLESMLEKLLGLALQAQGMQATVQFRFAELRASEMMRDAQTEAARIANAVAKRDQGWITQDEAAQEIVGHPAVGEPADDLGALLQPTSSAMSKTAGRQMAFAPDQRAEPFVRVTIIPEGADEPLPPIPDEVVISEGDMDRSLRLWDDLMPEWAGLLDSSVEGQADFDGEQAQRQTEFALGGARRPLAPGETPWTWDARTRRYRNNATGRWVSNEQMVTLRDQFVAANREWMRIQAQRLSTGELTVQQWELQFRQRLKQVFVDQYCLARGGRRAMTQSDWGQVGGMLKNQYGYLHDFAAQIANGELSASRIASRSTLYVEASTQAYERGRAAGYGMPRLPAYPGDGSTECMANCKCTWSIQETETAWLCTWTLHQAEHCATCVDRSVSWAPLEILKQV